MSDSHEHAGFTAPEPSELAPLFPGYEIQSLIATGGMGAVYSAVQKSLDRMVALKILPKEFSKDAAFCAGFEAEAKAMARLNHPNLIGVYDFGEVNGMLYIIMEFVAGKSVYHATYGTAVDPAEVIRLVSGVCSGLAHAHENGILHRDIKPSNILLDLNGQPKIGDFGLARPADRQVEEGEEIFGTPHYTAPEVVNSPHSVDYRADIFSVGVLLHELLTGKLPAADPRPASTIVKCDTRFDAIIRRATQTMPAARHSSAMEIAKELEVIAASVARTVPRAGAGMAPRPPKAGRRRYPAATAKKSSNGPTIAAVLVLVVGGIAAFAFFSGKPPEKKEVAPVVVVPVPKEEPVNRFPTPVAPKVEEPAPSRTEESTVDTNPFGSKEPPVVQVAVGDPEEAETGSEPALPAPKFDVSGFFGRARKIMQEKAKPQLGNYQTNVKSNFSDFSSTIERQTRRMKLNGTKVDSSIATKITSLQGRGVIPQELDSGFDNIPDIETIHRSSLTRQLGIQDTLDQGLSQLAATYIVGLEKQIERLDAKEDPGAVGLIQREIAKTKKSSAYFSKLMQGLDPDKDSDDED